MNGRNKCCEINTVSLKYGSLQVHLWNNDASIEKMNNCNWCRQITDFFQYIHAWNQGGIIIINCDIFLLQFLFSAKTQYIWKNAWLQLLFYYRKRPFIEWLVATGIENTRSLQVPSWNNGGNTQKYLLRKGITTLKK